jgi:ATP adenylyltransferase
MEIKWTPWRMPYILSQKGGGCIFCDKAAQDEDRQNLIVWRGEHCFVLLNLYPYNNGHLMVAPYVHVADLAGLDEGTAAEMTFLAQRSLRALRRALSPQGFNLGMNLGRLAGAGIVDHVHLHIVPRWLGDTNFMPVVGGTKLIPELLEDTYEKVRQAFLEERSTP